MSSPGLRIAFRSKACSSAQIRPQADKEMPHVTGMASARPSHSIGLTGIAPRNSPPSERRVHLSHSRRARSSGSGSGTPCLLLYSRQGSRRAVVDAQLCAPTLKKNRGTCSRIPAPSPVRGRKPRRLRADGKADSTWMACAYDIMAALWPLIFDKPDATARARSQIIQPCAWGKP